MKLRTSRSSSERRALSHWDDEGGAPAGAVRSRSGKAQDDRNADRQCQDPSGVRLKGSTFKRDSMEQPKA